MFARILCFVLLLCVIAAPASLRADNFILTDVFDGSELKTDPLPGTCNSTTRALRYQTVSVTVSTTDSYVIQDIFNFDGVDVSVLVYEGSFDPGNPNANLITPNGIDLLGSATLNGGVQYVFVMQQWCDNFEGAWAVSISGAGTVTADVTADLPEMTDNSISMGGATAELGCGSTNYRVFENQTVSETGTYFYTDLSISLGFDICVNVYEGSFDPANPETNLVAALDDNAVIDLDDSKTYVFVVQPFDQVVAGDYFFALAPPATFVITQRQAGSWAFAETDGSGIFMDIFDENNLMFIAWFTYDLARPDPSVTAMIGDPGHRWVTGIGPFSGDTGTLELYWTSGMIFDSGTPPPETVQDGTMTIKMFDCISGLVTYDLGSAGVTGEFPIARLAAENERECERGYEGPASPGPL